MPGQYELPDDAEASFRQRARADLRPPGVKPAPSASQILREQMWANPTGASVSPTFEPTWREDVGAAVAGEGGGRMRSLLAKALVGTTGPHEEGRGSMSLSGLAIDPAFDIFEGLRDRDLGKAAWGAANYTPLKMGGIGLKAAKAMNLDDIAKAWLAQKGIR